MKSTFFYLALAGLGLSALSCKPDLDVPAPDKGTLDLTRYVAYGNSLTAGYADGGLYRESQLYSYPNIIAQQMKMAGGGEFEQPLFAVERSNGSGYLYLSGFTPQGLPDLKDITQKPGFDPTSLAYTGAVGGDGRTLLLTPYTTTTAGQVTPQNLGVPGIRLSDVFTKDYGASNPLGFNPFFERFKPGAASYTEIAAKSKPTFFTSWLGNNDVLSFALAGGDLNGDGTTDLAGMTTAADFEKFYRIFLDSLKKSNTSLKGMLANIPNVTSIPNFTTITPTLATIQGKMVNPAVDGLYIQTTDGIRKATDEDLLPLTTQLVIGRADTIVLPGVGPIVIPHGFNVLNPLRNNEVLDKVEAAACADRTAEINARIVLVAAAYDLALWDANSFLVKVKPGTYFEGIKFSGDFISGNAFSLDGVHLTPMGNALAANKMIETINAKYGSRIPTVSLTHYRGVRFPG